MALPDPSLVSPTIAVARMLPGLKRWLDRNRVEVTPIRVGPCQDRDLMTGQVIVDPLLIQKIQDWVRAISAKTIPDHPTAADVLDALDVLEKAVVQAQEVRSFLQQKIREISVFDRDPHREKQKKHDFIKELLSPERTIIRQAILGVLLRQADFRGPEDGGEPARPLVAEWEEIEGEPGGYKIHLYDGIMIFSAARKSDQPHLLPGLRTLCYFDIEALGSLLTLAHDRLANLAFDSPMLMELRTALETVQCLIAMVNLQNVGTSAATFTMEARWRRSSLASIESALPLERVSVGCNTPVQGPLDNPELAHVAAGGQQCIRYLTRAPLAQLRANGFNPTEFSRADSVIELKRLGPKSGKSAWIAGRIGPP